MTKFPWYVPFVCHQVPAATLRPQAEATRPQLEVWIQNISMSRLRSSFGCHTRFAQTWAIAPVLMMGLG
jgi:hypothetical protein